MTHNWGWSSGRSPRHPKLLALLRSRPLRRRQERHLKQTNTFAINCLGSCGLFARRRIQAKQSKAEQG